jgi:hypothetical protein
MADANGAAGADGSILPIGAQASGKARPVRALDRIDGVELGRAGALRRAPSRDGRRPAPACGAAPAPRAIDEAGGGRTGGGHEPAATRRRRERATAPALGEEKPAARAKAADHETIKPHHHTEKEIPTMGHQNGTVDDVSNDLHGSWVIRRPAC